MQSDDLGLVAELRSQAALKRDCNVCDGDGIKDGGRPCLGCDQTGSVPVHWGRVGEMMSEAAAAIERLEAENRALTEALTPSGATKAAYIGEFSFNVEGWDPEGGEDGEGEAVTESKTVPWTTVKEIMAAISARARQALGDT